jgi:hypothetical protein
MRGGLLLYFLAQILRVALLSCVCVDVRAGNAFLRVSVPGSVMYSDGPLLKSCTAVTVDLEAAEAAGLPPSRVWELEICLTMDGGRPMCGRLIRNMSGSVFRLLFELRAFEGAGEEGLLSAACCGFDLCHKYILYLYLYFLRRSSIRTAR